MAWMLDGHLFEEDSCVACGRTAAELLGASVAETRRGRQEAIDRWSADLERQLNLLDESAKRQRKRLRARQE